MSTGDPSARQHLARAVERQMRHWELARAQRPAPASGGDDDHAGPFVTISRLVGAGGFDIATQLAERLTWPIFDRQILQTMANDDLVRTRLYEQMDERDMSWLDSAVRWLIRGELNKDDYFRRLSETVLTIARQGSAIFVGRGADLILRSTAGLRVSIVAPREQRIATLAERHGSAHAEAEVELERIDHERREFVRQYFGKGADDPARYDVVLNSARLTETQSVEVILAVLRTCELIP